MKKIISLFVRDYGGDRLVRDEVVPGAEWVIAGEGIATRKWDGTCCMVKDGKLYKRLDAKRPDRAPADFIPAAEYDAENRHYLGWVPVNDGPSDKWHREAWANIAAPPLEDGTYELVGPNVQGGADGGPVHTLVRHGCAPMIDFPREYEAIKLALSDGLIEGVVWRHPDGRMVKIKAKDFGIKRAKAVQE